MIGGITTYLIIYIQFYALYGKDDHGTPSKGQSDAPNLSDLSDTAHRSNVDNIQNSRTNSRMLPPT